MMNELALCAGNGGLSLGLRLACPEARTVCVVEREAFAAADLVRKMQAGRLDQSPVWSDLLTFDARPWRGTVDIVTAGFPCQPFSAAGKRLGVEDGRWLWPDIARIVEECQPSLVFLENVPGLVRRGLANVLRGLARLGFNAEWDLFSAAELGAPHIRKRVFVLAANPDREQLRQEQGWGESKWTGEAKFRDGGAASAYVADAKDDHRRGRECGEEERAREDSERRGGSPGGGTVSGFWATEPDVGRVVDGSSPSLDRIDRLRSIGNGVVPLCVAVAWKELSRRLKCHAK